MSPGILFPNAIQTSMATTITARMGISFSLSLYRKLFSLISINYSFHFTGQAELLYLY